jgi:hypothetical protein
VANFPHKIGYRFTAGTKEIFPKSGLKSASSKLFFVSCTKSGQSVVDLLHIAAIKRDANVSFLLTLKIEGVQTQSFFDTALKFNWLVRLWKSSEIALRRRKTKGGEGYVRI